MRDHDAEEEHLDRTLRDLVRFAEEVRAYVTDAGEHHFYDHRPTQLVAEALLHRIGEAVARLPGEFTDAHPEVSWRQMKAMRNVVAHEYGYVDYRLVWRALSTNLVSDAEAIERLLAERRECWSRVSEPGEGDSGRGLPADPGDGATGR